MAEGMEKGHKGFEKGHAPLAGCGRPLGSKNANVVIKNYLKNAVVDLFPDFLAALKTLKETDAKSFCAAYIKTIEFVTPKMAAVQVEDVSGSNSATEHLNQIASWADDNIEQVEDEKD